MEGGKVIKEIQNEKRGHVPNGAGVVLDLLGAQAGRCNYLVVVVGVLSAVDRSRGICSCFGICWYRCDDDDEMKRKPRPSCPTEAQEMEALARYLDAKGYTWCHPPNEGLRSPRTGARLKRQGMKAGVPDVLIFDKFVVKDGTRHMDKPPLAYSGIAIELKRNSGGVVSDAQHQWLNTLVSLGWAVAVCWGFGAAQKFIESFEREKRP